MEREVIKAEVKCSMCGGVGFNQFEPECENCGGTGRITTDVYELCGHEVESEDCRVSGCLCEQMVDLGSYCDNPYWETVREPFTPAGFELRCCQDCAEDYLKQGYLKARAA